MSDRLHTQLADLDKMLEQEKKLSTTLKDLRKAKKSLLKELELSMKENDRTTVTTPAGIPMQLTHRLEFTK